MLARLLSLSLAAALLTIPRAALAEDAGQGAADGATAGDAGGEGSNRDAASPEDSGSTRDSASIEDSGEEACEGPGCPPVAVVACDGALCDTQQGRPVCDVAGPVGGAPVDSGVLFVLSVPVALVGFRKLRCGASRPGNGGGAC